MHELLGDVVAYEETCTLTQAEQVLLSLKHLCDGLIHINVLISQGHVDALREEFNVADECLPSLLHLLV